MKNKNFFQSAKNASNGLLHAVRNERNMKFHVVVSAGVLLASYFFQLTRMELVVVCLTIGGVIACELFNTAIEGIVDIIVDVYHPKAKIIKDVAAGAVWLSAGVAVVIGYVIFFDRVMALLLKLLAI